MEKTNNNYFSYDYKYKDLKTNTSSNCYVLHCRKCHNQMNEEEIPREKKGDEPPKLKRYKQFKCYFDCQYCRKYIIYKRDERMIEMALHPEIYEARSGRNRRKQDKEFESDSLEELKQKISNLKPNEIIKINIPKDGNCMYHAVVRGCNESEERHLELRQKVADYIESTCHEEDENVIKSLGYSSKDEYILNSRKNVMHWYKSLLISISDKLIES